jgi:hypothetical protein
MLRRDPEIVGEGTGAGCRRPELLEELAGGGRRRSRFEQEKIELLGVQRALLDEVRDPCAAGKRTGARCRGSGSWLGLRGLKAERDGYGLVLEVTCACSQSTVGSCRCEVGRVMVELGWWTLVLNEEPVVGGRVGCLLKEVLGFS